MSYIGEAMAGRSEPGKAVSIKALSALNFFLADVRDGLGPFLGVFLLGRGWGADDIGYVMTLGGLAGMIATTPLGALVDATRAKRLFIALGAILTIVGSVLILTSDSFEMVAASQIGTGIVGAVIGPAIAGLTLGIVGQAGLAHQLGRNEAWNHAGNVVSAVLAGVAGYYYGLVAVFALMGLLAAGSILCVFAIREADIDHDVARGLERSDRESQEKPGGFDVLLTSRPLIVLALTLLVFHLGNAAMLPLLGQSIASRDLADPAVFTAATVVVAQLTMIPIALISARIAEKRGYWILVMAALAALPVRGLVAGMWHTAWSAIPLQILDGVGAGLLGVAIPGLVAQLLRGTGRVNAALGAVMTVQGVGAALSPALGGIIAASYGYEASFLTLGVIAVVGVGLWMLMPRLDTPTSLPPDMIARSSA